MNDKFFFALIEAYFIPSCQKLQEYIPGSPFFSSFSRTLTFYLAIVKPCKLKRVKESDST